MQGLPIWLRAAIIAAVAGLAAELLIWVLRRGVKAFVPGWLHHSWAAVGVVYLFCELRPESSRENTSLWAFSASLALVLTSLVVFSLVDQLLFLRPWDSGKGRLMPALVRDVARVLLVLVMSVVAASAIHDLDLGTVLVSSTVVSAVLGLALQDMLKNVFAGMAIQMEGFPKIGDWIELDGSAARVVEMSWRSTRLRTNEGVEIIEPNSAVALGRVINYGSGRRPVAFHLDIGLPYGEPPARVKAALLAAARRAPWVEERPTPHVFLHSYGDSSIVYRLRVWTRHVQRQRRFKDGVLSRIWYQLQRAGIEIPFPVRRVHLQDAGQETRETADRRSTEAAELLRQVSVFSGLDDGAIEEIASRSQLQEFDDGELLICEGEKDASLMVIARGEVKVRRRKGGRDVDLAELGRGDFFGEMSLLTDAPRSATITANGPCQALVIRRPALEPTLDREPDLVRVLAVALAERASASAELVEQAPEPASSQPKAAEHSFIQRIQRLFRLSSGGRASL